MLTFLDGLNCKLVWLVVTVILNAMQSFFTIIFIISLPLPTISMQIVFIFKSLPLRVKRIWKQAKLSVPLACAQWHSLPAIFLYCASSGFPLLQTP